MVKAILHQNGSTKGAGLKIPWQRPSWVRNVFGSPIDTVFPPPPH
ncbi:MAG: hypothetical protein ACFFC3_09160 [Candidatus Odinarchaeota archaeon]